MTEDPEVYLTVDQSDRQQVARRLLDAAEDLGQHAVAVRSTTEGFTVPRSVFEKAGFLPAPATPDAVVDEADVPVPATTAPAQRKAAPGGKAV